MRHRSNPAAALDPTALTTFVMGLGNIGPEEIERAKALYILNAISDYKAAIAMQKPMLMIMTVMCIIPIFLLPTIPAWFAFSAMRRNFREKIHNAITVWDIDRAKYGIPDELP